MPKKSAVPLTKTNIKKLKVGESLTESGVTAKRFDSGIQYTVRTMVAGELHYKMVGWDHEGVTPEKAREAVSNLKRDARYGDLKILEQKKETHTFTEAAQKHVEHMSARGDAPLHIKRTVERLNKNILPVLGNKQVDRLTKVDLETYVGQRRRVAKNATINRELCIIRQTLKLAEENGWLTKRPNIGVQKEEEVNKVYLSADQVEKLKRTARAYTRVPYVWLFIEVGMGTSMRKTEILTIEVDNIDVDRKMIFLPKAKAGSRKQPITSELADILRDYLAALPEGQMYLFPSDTAPSGHIESIDGSFETVVALAGLDPRQVTPHTMRHTVVSHLVQSGVDLPTVARIAGHKTILTTMKYTHQHGSHLEQAMDRLEMRIGTTKGQNSSTGDGPSDGVEQDNAKGLA